MTTFSDCEHRYYEILETFFRPKGNIFHNIDNVWFHQAEATAHISSHSVRVFREMFPGHLISLVTGDIGWPARSPDLNPCEFFFCGYLKSQVYINCPRSDLIFKTNETERHYMYFKKNKNTFIIPTNVSDHFALPCICTSQTFLFIIFLFVWAIFDEKEVLSILNILKKVLDRLIYT